MRSYLSILLAISLILSCKKHSDPPAITRMTGEETIGPNYGYALHYEADDAGRMTRFLYSDTSGKVWSRAIGSDSVVNFFNLDIGTEFKRRFVGSVYGGQPSARKTYIGTLAVDSSQFSYDGSGRITRLSDNYGTMADISYDGKGNIARIYQIVKNGANYIVWADITPVHYDNHPTPYSLAGKGLFFISGKDDDQADLRYLTMLGKNNPTEVHFRGFDQATLAPVTYQAIIEYDYNEKGYPTVMTVTASDSLGFLNTHTNLRLLYKNYFSYQDF